MDGIFDTEMDFRYHLTFGPKSNVHRTNSHKSGGLENSRLL